MDITIIIGLVLNFSAVVIKSILDIIKQRDDNAKTIDLRQTVDDVKSVLQLLREHDKRSEVASARIEANIAKS